MLYLVYLANDNTYRHNVKLGIVFSCLMWYFILFIYLFIYLLNKFI